MMAKSESYVSSTESDSSSSDSEDGSALTTTVECMNDSVPPNYFGNIDVKNSANVHFGNTAIYNGDVTVQQFVSTTAQLPPNITDLTSVNNEKYDPIDSKSRVTDTKVNPSVTDASRARPPLAQQFSIIVANTSGEQGGHERKKRLLLLFAFVVLGSIIVVSVVIAALNAGGGTLPAWGGKDWDGFKNGSYFLKGNEGSAPFYSRINWLAQPVAGYETLEHPVPYVVISHSASNTCNNHTQCVYMVRNIQTFHIEGKNWIDIGYNFLVGGDGGIYEGRGWDAIGAHTYGYNNKSIGICFIGTFTALLPPPEQVRAAKLLIEEGVKLKKISQQYKLLAHRQVSATESPGEAFYEKEIKKWPHWSELP